MVPSTTLDGFPTLTIPDGAAPDAEHDLTSLSSPTEFPPSEPIEQRLDGPTFGTEAAPPRSAIAAAESTAPWWLLVTIAALVAGILALIARHRRSQDWSADI